MTGSLWFYDKDKATTFDADIANNIFIYFEYKGLLLQYAVADGNNTILNHVTIAVQF